MASIKIVYLGAKDVHYQVNDFPVSKPVDVYGVTINIAGYSILLFTFTKNKNTNG